MTWDGDLAKLGQTIHNSAIHGYKYPIEINLKASLLLTKPKEHNQLKQIEEKTGFKNNSLP